MKRSLALAMFEFRNLLNFKADLLSIALIGALVFFRLFAIDLFQNSVPLEIAIHTEDASIAQAISESDNEQLARTNLMLSLTKAQEALQGGDIDAYITICTDCSPMSITVNSVKPVDALDYISTINRALSDAVIPAVLELSDEEYALARDGFETEFYADEGQLNNSAKFINILIMILMIVSVLSAFALLLQGITAEKDEKVTEMYMSCMYVYEWVDGKVMAALAVSIKSFFIYLALGLALLQFLGTIELSLAEVIDLLTSRGAALLITFSVGFVFWSYFYALASVFLNSSTMALKNAAVILPMSAFAIVLSASDYVAANFYPILCLIPFTYIFAVPMQIMSSEYSVADVLIYGVVLVFWIYVARHLTCRSLKFAQ